MGKFSHKACTRYNFLLCTCPHHGRSLTAPRFHSALILSRNSFCTTSALHFLNHCQCLSSKRSVEHHTQRLIFSFHCNSHTAYAREVAFRPTPIQVSEISQQTIIFRTTENASKYQTWSQPFSVFIPPSMRPTSSNQPPSFLIRNRVLHVIYSITSPNALKRSNSITQT